MAIGPVSWGEYPGEYLEKVMAVFISQEHDNVTRRTPSSGDGGVDILVPVGSGWLVRQVKGFTGRMTSDRRRQVKGSLTELLEDPRLKAPVLDWRLTVPIDWTSGEQDWFEELVEGLTFKTQWEGKVFWDAMSAKHPHVVDYYFRDGRARIEQDLRTLLDAAEASRRVVSPLKVEQHLEDLRLALNRGDPHYRYEFATGLDVSDPRSLPSGVVAAKSRSMTDGTLLSTLVLERYAGASQDAPLEGNLKIVVYDPNRGIDLRQDFEGFQTYGRALDIPEGAMTGDMQAPAGFYGNLEGAAGRIGERSILITPTRTRVAALHPDDGIVSELLLVSTSVTRGELGGIEVHATDERNIVRARFTIEPPGKVPPPASFQFSVEPFSGFPVLDCLPVLRLVDRFRPPIELRWLEEFGTTTIAKMQFTEPMDVMPGWLLPLLENLATLQQNVRGTVTVPHAVSASMLADVEEVAVLLREGEIRGTWEEFELPVAEAADDQEIAARLSQPGALVISGNQVVEIEDRAYEIGPITQVVASARLADEQPLAGVIVLVPGEDNTLVKRVGLPE